MCTEADLFTNEQERCEREADGFETPRVGVQGYRRVVSARPATTEYRVWSEVKTFDEEADASHVVAEFRFLQEASDYASYCRDRGASVVITGPYGFTSVCNPATS